MTQVAVADAKEILDILTTGKKLKFKFELKETAITLRNKVATYKSRQELQLAEVLGHKPEVESLRSNVWHTGGITYMELWFADRDTTVYPYEIVE